MRLRGSDFLFIALGAGALYLAWKAVKGAGQVGAAIANAPAAIGTSLSETLFDWTHPYDARTDTFYVVAFPDGMNHAVQASNVADDGSFNFGGANYLLKVNSAGKKVAVLQ